MRLRFRLREKSRLRFKLRKLLTSASALTLPFSMALVIQMIFGIIAGCESKKDAGEKVIAQINGKEIREDDFKMRFSRLPASLKTRYSDEKGKKEFLEEIIKRELLLQEAKRLGIERDRVLLERIEEMRERMTLNEFLQREVEDKLVTTDKELEDYYNLHREEFKSPDEARVSQIVVKSDEDGKVVLNKLHNGADFARMAKEFSIDIATKNSGGNLGIIQKGRIYPQLDSAIFSMNEGEISGPIETETGYHIVKLHEKRPGVPLSFKDARNIVMQRYHLEKRSKVFEELVTGLRSKASITISEENLRGADVNNKSIQ